MDEYEEEMLETHNEVLEETVRAFSLACSGATDVDAATTFVKLLFKRHDPNVQIGKSFLPEPPHADLGGREALRLLSSMLQQPHEKYISNKSFRLRACRLRSSEKMAIVSTDEMDHTPIGSIIFPLGRS